MSTNMLCDVCMGIIGPGHEYIRIELDIQRARTKGSGPSKGQEGTAVTELQILRDYHVVCCPSKEEILALFSTAIVRLGNPTNVDGRLKDD